MSSRPSRTQVTKQQPAVSLKNRSVSLMISLITFYDRRKGHVHKQDVFHIIFIILRKLLVSDFYSTYQSCEQPVMPTKSDHLPSPEWSVFAYRPPFFCTRNSTSTVHASCHSSRLSSPHSKKLSKQWERHAANVVS